MLLLEPGQLRLELADVAAVVGEPASVQQVVDALEQAGAITDVRAADVEGLGERGRPARDRQILHPLLADHRVRRPGRRAQTSPPRVRSARAGTPPTCVRSGTSAITTAPAVTTQPAPILT